MASKIHPNNFLKISMQTCPLLSKLGKKICPKNLSNNTMLIIYKLLHDSLFVAIIFFTFALIAEAVLPSIIISHVGFSKMVIAILLNIFFLKFLAKKITLDQISVITPTKNKSRKKIIFPFTILGALLIFNGQLGMNIFLNLFLLLTCLTIGHLSYQILFHEE